MHNKPDFKLFSNIGYALAGMRAVLSSEKSFRIQLIVIAVLSIVILAIPVSFYGKAALFVSMWFVPAMEAVNSAIERVVDLVTQEHHPLAGEAKDIGAFAVMMAFFIALMVWSAVLYGEFG